MISLKTINKKDHCKVPIWDRELNGLVQLRDHFNYRSVTPIMMHIMKTSADLDTAIAASQEQAVIIFKHSASCPFSAMAQLEITNGKHDLDVYGLVVQYAGDLSEAVSERLGAEHRSPQALVVHQGKVIADYWRSEIKEHQLRQDVKNAGVA